MPGPKRGEVWLLRFPFTDLSSTKVRPALVIATYGEDVIMLGIFSRVPTTAPRDTWVQIDATHPQFRQIGLRQTSVLKAERIAVVHESVFQRKLGEFPPDLMAQVQDALKKALHL